MTVENSKELSTETILYQVVEVLVSAINARNHAASHSTSVATYAVKVATELGWHEKHIEQVRLGALLHDIGQIFWPDELVRKQGSPLSEEERKVIESHTYKGADLLKDWPALDFVRPYILYHQEWIDGSGYPYRIKGDRIPQEVQIVSLADVYEALVNPRIYKRRQSFSRQEAIKIMTEMRGRRWEENLFDIFVEIVAGW